MRPITPDTKDWTWVLERTCSECGFDVTGFPRQGMGAMIRENAAEWRDLLDHPKVRERPSDDKWSALEYACHVRDVFRLYDERLQMMLEQDDPTYPNWDQDEAAIAQRYRAQEPDVVARELVAAARELAERFQRVSDCAPAHGIDRAMSRMRLTRPMRDQVLVGSRSISHSNVGPRASE